MFENRNNLHIPPLHQLPVELNCRIFQLLEKFDEGEARVVNSIWNRFILLEKMRRIGLQVLLAHSVINDKVRQGILKNKILYSQFSQEDKFLLKHPPAGIKKRLLEIGLRDEKAALEIIKNHSLWVFLNNYHWDSGKNSGYYTYNPILKLAKKWKVAAVALLSNQELCQKININDLIECAKGIDLLKINPTVRKEILQEKSDALLRKMPEGSDERIEMIEALKLSAQLQEEVERKIFEEDLDRQMLEMQEYYNKMHENPQNTSEKNYLDENDILFDGDIVNDSSDDMSFTNDALSVDESDKDDHRHKRFRIV
jgi:hypothetical protein